MVEHLIICTTIFLIVTRNSGFFYLVAVLTVALQIIIIFHFDIKLESKPKVICRIIPIPLLQKTFSICPK
jgi:hypothetical protein